MKKIINSIVSFAFFEILLTSRENATYSEKTDDVNRSELTKNLNKKKESYRYNSVMA